MGAYPNIFLQVSEAEIPELVAKIEGLRNEADYSALLDRFGIRRTDARFWAVSDQVSAGYRNSEALTHGVLATAGTRTADALIAGPPPSKVSGL